MSDLFGANHKHLAELGQNRMHQKARNGLLIRRIVPLTLAIKPKHAGGTVAAAIGQ